MQEGQSEMQSYSRGQSTSLILQGPSPAWILLISEDRAHDNAEV
jgi:hypothetical protein